MQVNNGEVELHVAVDGEGDRTIVLLHGITLSSATWDWLVPDLVDRGLRVVRPDARGHGRSDRAPGAYELDDYVGDAIAVLEAVADGPVALVGHSLGGVTAAAVAQQRPYLVDRFLLEDPALLLADELADEGPAQGPLMDTFRLLRKGLPHVQSRGIAPEAYADQLAKVPTPFGVPAGERYHDDTMLAWARSQLHLDVRVLDPVLEPSAGRPVGAFDLSEPLKMAGVVLGADMASPDRVTSRRDEELLVANGARVDFVRVKGAGHNLHDEHGGRAVFRQHLDWLLNG